LAHAGESRKGLGSVTLKINTQHTGTHNFRRANHLKGVKEEGSSQGPGDPNFRRHPREGAYHPGGFASARRECHLPLMPRNNPAELDSVLGSQAVAPSNVSDRLRSDYLGG